MSTHRLALTDGGMETFLLFHEGLSLPLFATFPLLEGEEGRASLRRYFEPFLALARRREMAFLLGTVTWRANPEWGRRLGYDLPALASANRDAVAFARELADGAGEVSISGGLGPRGDGYAVGQRMSAEEARDYHSWQVDVLAEAGVDLITATTMTYVEEAVGVVAAAGAAGVPVVVSFTVETDGRLPDGTALGEAIRRTDDASDAAPEYFMVNCAHPTHVARGLDDAPELARLGGFRFNASRRSHAELDAAEELDGGDPLALAQDAAALCGGLRGVRVLGGCCGTDLRHVEALLERWPG